jgi:hypothetical protein
VREGSFTVKGNGFDVVPLVVSFRVGGVVGVLDRKRIGGTRDPTDLNNLFILVLVTEKDKRIGIVEGIGGGNNGADFISSIEKGECEIVVGGEGDYGEF